MSASENPSTTNSLPSTTDRYFFRASADDFKKIPGNPIAYWTSDQLRKAFKDNVRLEEIAPVKVGLQTGNNERFVREWFEVSRLKISFYCKSSHDFSKKWFPYNKGGEYRKWYGNNENIVNWEKNGYEIKSFTDEKGKLRSRPQNCEYYFHESITWSFVSSSYFGVRFSDTKAIFDVAGSSAFPSEEDRYFLTGLLCSNISHGFMKAMNPTLNFQVGNVALIPIILNQKYKFIDEHCKQLIAFHKIDWNSYESSWDFIELTLLNSNFILSTAQKTYQKLRSHWHSMTLEMKRLEEENNRIFIDAYGLQDELTPDVPLQEITLTCNPVYRYGAGKTDEEYESLLRRDTAKELISYAIGCMMGRYSLDKPGLVYANAGGEGFDPQNYMTFPADADGIVPLTGMAWFPDDTANRLEEFIATAWPREHLEENLAWIASSLGISGDSPREIIRSYLADKFYKDHLQTYKKRPIYWLFTSGKQQAFQALVYLHRYNPGTLSRMRTEYVIPLQSKFTARIAHLEDDIAAATSTSARKKLEREKETIVKQQAELHHFEEKLRHLADQRISLDLDDGVKVNYGKFDDLLAETKSICKKEEE